jgi:hypothetical protein
MNDDAGGAPTPPSRNDQPEVPATRPPEGEDQAEPDAPSPGAEQKEPAEPEKPDEVLPLAPQPSWRDRRSVGVARRKAF